MKARLPHKDTSTTAAEEETQKKNEKKFAEKKINESKTSKKKGKYTVQQNLGANSCVSEICVISTKRIFFVSVYFVFFHTRNARKNTVQPSLGNSFLWKDFSSSRIYKMLSTRALLMGFNFVLKTSDRVRFRVLGLQMICKRFLATWCGSNRVDSCLER